MELLPESSNWGYHIATTANFNYHASLILESKINNPDFKVNYSFIYGDYDWAYKFNKEAAEELV
jgi:hypothetical protein